MRSDLIAVNFQRVSLHQWWSEYEFGAVVYTLKNFYLSTENAIEFHSKTGLLSKTTTEVTTFASHIKKLCLERKKGEVQVSPTIAHQNAAPYDVQSSKSSWTWMKISAKDSAIISDRIELVNGVKNLLQDLPNAEPSKSFL